MMSSELPSMNPAAAAAQPLDGAIPVHVAVAEADRQEPGRDAMGGQEQGIGQLIDRAGHVAGDEAGAEPVGGAIDRDELPQSDAEELARRAAEPVQDTLGAGGGTAWRPV